MKKSTIVDLPLALEIAFGTNRSPLLKTIIKEAREGEFHDYKNTKYACGKVQLAIYLEQLKDPRADKIREDVINGVYDEPADEEDNANMKKDWLENGGSEELWNVMFPE